jgi:hypothetical protein
MNGDASAANSKKSSGGLWLFLLVLAGALSVLCHEAYLPHHVFWANDVPLGAMLDPSSRLPGSFAGHWGTLYYIGGSSPSSSPALSTLLQMVVSPYFYLRIFVPLNMLFLGLGAWTFFRQLGFAKPVCIIAALGAGLNMHCFSNAAWGLGQWNISAGMVFFALAALVSPSIRPLWVKAAIVGFSLGMVVMEGFDLGAIMSLYVGMYIIFHFLREKPNPVHAIPRAVGMGTIIVLAALLISGSTLYTLVGTQIKGISNTGSTPEEKEGHWNFTTQWSFPKLETIRLFVPGVFGYRLQDYITDTNRASAYWGKIAEDPHVDQLESDNPQERAHSAASLGLPPDIQTVMAGNDLAARGQIMDQIKSQMQRRHTGSGDYTGVLVCLLAVFAVFNGWRKVTGPYSKGDREAVWFWSVAALISLMAAWGRYGSIYQIIYHLPFLGNIRNPIKFLHPLNLCLIVLSAYGLEALHRKYMRDAVNRAGALPGHFMQWWRKAGGFEKKWIIGSLAFFGLSLAGFAIMSSSRTDLIHYLEHNGFPGDSAPGQAALMADFSIKEVVWYLFFYGTSVAVLAGILSHAWSGRRASLAWVVLGAIMICDLYRADVPWVRYYDYEKVYSMNPVVDFLRKDPWEHRVMSRFSPTGGYMPGGGNLPALCHWWLENDYLANNIESLEIDQAPRLPDMDRNYIGNFGLRSQQDLSPAVRMWRLTNTRYLLADARLTPALNQMAEPKNSFTNVMLMDIVPKPGVEHIRDAGDLTVKTNDNGAVALIEFTKALPRAKLYSNWQVTNDDETLKKLNSTEFDPDNTVLVAVDTPVTEKPGQPGADAGEVHITSYQPRDVQLKADAKTPAVLLLNDRVGDYWTVKVDGQPASVLRCNYIMRGVFLPPGQHQIVFHFRAPLQWLYVSLSAFGVAVLLIGYVAVRRLTAGSSATTPDAGASSSQKR